MDNIETCYGALRNKAIHIHNSNPGERFGVLKALGEFLYDARIKLKTQPEKLDGVEKKVLQLVKHMLGYSSGDLVRAVELHNPHGLLLLSSVREQPLTYFDGKLVSLERGIREPSVDLGGLESAVAALEADFCVWKQYQTENGKINPKKVRPLDARLISASNRIYLGGRYGIPPNMSWTWKTVSVEGTRPEFARLKEATGLDLSSLTDEWSTEKYKGLAWLIFIDSDVRPMIPFTLGVFQPPPDTPRAEREMPPLGIGMRPIYQRAVITCDPLDAVFSRQDDYREAAFRALVDHLRGPFMDTTNGSHYAFARVMTKTPLPGALARELELRPVGQSDGMFVYSLLLDEGIKYRIR